MGQSELMTPAEFVKMYEKPPQVTMDGGQYATKFSRLDVVHIYDKISNYSYFLSSTAVFDLVLFLIELIWPVPVRLFPYD